MSPSNCCPRDPHPWPMAKWPAAEPLKFHVPWKPLLLSDFPGKPPLWVPLSGATRPLKGQGTREPWRSLCLGPISNIVVGMTYRSCGAVTWSPESHLLGSRAIPAWVSWALGSGNRVESEGSPLGADRCTASTMKT